MLTFSNFIKKQNQFTIEEDSTMTSSSGDIRGLGMVSGNPAGTITTYTALNASDADTQDQILKKLIKVNHHDYHVDKTKAQNKK